MTVFSVEISLIKRKRAEVQALEVHLKQQQDKIGRFQKYQVVNNQALKKAICKTMRSAQASLSKTKQ